MATQIGKNMFAGTQPPFIPSFNYQDLIAGNLIVPYYGVASNSGALKTSYSLITAPNVLLNSLIDSTPLSTTGTMIAAANSYSIVTDLNFDIPINYPVLIKGKILANLTFELGSLGPPTAYASFAIVMQKISQGITTSFATLIAQEKAQGTGDFWFPLVKRTAMSAIVDTPVKISPNDILRARLMVNAGNDVGNAQTVKIYHDPNSRKTVFSSYSGVNESTKFIIGVPFKLDI